MFVLYLCNSTSRSQEEGPFVCPHRVPPFCCPQRIYMFKLVNACYVSMLFVVTKCVVLAAIGTLEVRILVYFFVRNEFHPSAIYVCP